MSDNIPAPSFTSTFRWADGGEIGDYGWMTSEDSFTDCISDADEPSDMLVETWERTSFEVVTLFPPLATCYVEDNDCEEDAVAWQRDGDEWIQVCERHRTAEEDKP